MDEFRKSGVAVLAAHMLMRQKARGSVFKWSQDPAVFPNYGMCQ